jgi:hypothetical protein
MTEWSLCRWHGAPADVAAALRALGWHGPDEAAAAALDPRIGGLIPAPGEPLRQVDGVAYATVVAAEPLGLPPGLSETGPELSTLLIGSF